MVKRVDHPVDKINPLRLYVNEADRGTITQAAGAAGLTVSTYLRACCLGRRVAPPRDHAMTDALLRLNADQARLGNLLKLYLQDRQPDRVAAQRLIRSLEETQNDLKAALRKIPP